MSAPALTMHDGEEVELKVSKAREKKAKQNISLRKNPFGLAAFHVAHNPINSLYFFLYECDERKCIMARFPVNCDVILIKDVFFRKATLIVASWIGDVLKKIIHFQFYSVAAFTFRLELRKT